MAATLLMENPSLHRNDRNFFKTSYHNGYGLLKKFERRQFKN